MKIEIERDSIGEWLTFGIVLFGILKYFSDVYGCGSSKYGD